MLLMMDSGLPCFKPESVQNFKDRFVLEKTEREAADFVKGLIKTSLSSYSTGVCKCMAAVRAWFPPFPALMTNCALYRRLLSGTDKQHSVLSFAPGVTERALYQELTSNIMFLSFAPGVTPQLSTTRYSNVSRELVCLSTALWSFVFLLFCFLVFSSISAP